MKHSNLIDSVLAYFCLQMVCHVLSKPVKQAAAGQSSVAYSQDHKGNYQFAYEISDKSGASNFRQESRNGKVVRGSYGLTDVDGRTRLVNYQADKHGFVAAIDTNEPGTGREDAANAIYNGPDKGKGWAYAVSLQDQPTAAPDKKNKKKAGYSATGNNGPSDMDDEHRYAPEEDERLYVRDEYSSAPSTTGSDTGTLHKSSSPVTSSTGASSIGSGHLDGPAPIGMMVGPNGSPVPSSGGNAPVLSSDHTDPNDVHISDSSLNDFNDDKSTASYSDREKTGGFNNGGSTGVSNTDEESTLSYVDSAPNHDYEYRKREFESKKNTRTPSYDQTLRRLAEDRFRTNRSPSYSSKPSMSGPLSGQQSRSSINFSSSARPVRVGSEHSFAWKK